MYLLEITLRVVGWATFLALWVHFCWSIIHGTFEWLLFAGLVLPVSALALASSMRRKRLTITDE